MKNDQIGNSKVITYFKKGNSFPILLDLEGIRYVVKLKSGLSGKYSMLNEWIGNDVGLQIGLNTRPPVWIELNDALEMDNINIEIQELIRKSFGLNIGFEYVEILEELNYEDVKVIREEERINLFLFDLFMINIDRTFHNTNLAWMNHKIYTLDFESSLLFNELLESRDLLKNERILQLLRANPLYTEPSQSQIDLFIEKLNGLSFEHIFQSLPDEFLKPREKSNLLERLALRKKKGWRMMEWIHQLKHIKIENKEERMTRIKANRNRFEQRMKS